VKNTSFTEIFQRIEGLRKHKNLSQTTFAEQIDIPQSTFTKQMKAKDNEKLAAYLWKIAVLYPEISRIWIFFGEGDMLASKNELQNERFQADNQDMLLQKIAFLEEQNKGLQADKDNQARIFQIALDSQTKAFDAAMDAKNEVLTNYRRLSAELVLKEEPAIKADPPAAKAAGQK